MKILYKIRCFWRGYHCAVSTRWEMWKGFCYKVAVCPCGAERWHAVPSGFAPDSMFPPQMRRTWTPKRDIHFFEKKVY